MTDYPLLNKEKETDVSLLSPRSTEDPSEYNNGSFILQPKDDGLLFRLTEAATMGMIARRDDGIIAELMLNTGVSGQTGANNIHSNVDPYKPVTVPATVAPQQEEQQKGDKSKDAATHDNKRRYSSNADVNPQVVASNLVEFNANTSRLPQFDGVDSNINNSNKSDGGGQCYVSCYYILRFLSVILSFFLCIVAINYGIGQLIALSAIDLFCATHDKEDVFEHNRQLNDSTGVGGCWVIDDAPLDSDSLFNDSFSTGWEFDIGSRLLCSIFLLMALYFGLIGSYFGWITCFDMYYQFFNTNDPNPRLVKNSIKLEKLRMASNDTDHDSVELSAVGQDDDAADDNYDDNHDHRETSENLGLGATDNTFRASRVNEVRTSKDLSLMKRARVTTVVYEGSLSNLFYRLCGCGYCSIYCRIYTNLFFNTFCCCFVEIYKKLDRLSFYHLYPDSWLKIHLKIFQDLVETIAQVWTLLVYAGVNELALGDNFTLAVYPWYVRSFSIIIGLNCLIGGILWMLYVVKHDWCNGQRFVSIVFVLDSTGDLLYSLFPLTLYSKHNSLFDALTFDKDALGHLHSENTILFLGITFAMLFMCHKVYTILRAFDPLYIEYRKIQYLTLRVKLRPYLRPRHSKQTKYIRKRRQFCLFFLGLLFAAIGTEITGYFVTYIHDATEYCTNPPTSALASNPELYYWKDSCQYRVFELNSKVSVDSCECRYMKWTVNATDYTQRGFDYSHISSMLHEWRMLQQLQIEILDDSTTTAAAAAAEEAANENGVPYISAMNLTENEFVAQKLQVFIMTRVRIESVDSSIKKLDSLEIFLMQNHLCRDLPWHALGSLEKLKLFDVGFAITLDTITADICRWKSLRYLSLSTTNVPKIPKCVNKLQELRRIDIRGLGNVKIIPKQLFELPELITVIALYGGYQNITFEPGDKWGSKLKRVYLQQTTSTADGICDNVDNLSNQTQYFINYFGACDRPCEGYGCSTYNWGNGICDTYCFSNECGYDNGDCSQLCLCDESLWGDGNCDNECNNYKCDYDFGDCLSYNGTDYCYGTNATLTQDGCPAIWLNDEWCDEYCMNDHYHEQKCITEINDCSDCGTDTSCYFAWNYIYGVAAGDTSLNYIDEDTVCNIWSFLSQYFDYNNCTTAFDQIDLNNDGQISFHETLILTREFFDLSYVKAYQLNCSLCLPDPSKFY